MSTPGTVIAGKFRLERVIGRGGMGSVWQARHLQLDMPVAVKFIEGAGANAADARPRFEREAKAAAQIRSPHIVQMLDHGLDGDSPYIVMELLEGEDLAARLRRLKRLPMAAVATIVTQVAKGLRKAHDLGIIHRDLKPSNIFLARIDDEEVAKVLDFGVAKRWTGDLGDNFTQAGTLLGSPSYMSPEQARGHRDIDHRSDLWSLAVIIFRAITGTKPFVGDSIAEMIVKICFDPLPIASRVTPELPSIVDDFFARGFERDATKRFQTAPELAAAFAAIARVSRPDIQARSSSSVSQNDGAVLVPQFGPPPSPPLHVIDSTLPDDPLSKVETHPLPDKTAPLPGTATSPLPFTQDVDPYMAGGVGGPSAHSPSSYPQPPEAGAMSVQEDTPGAAQDQQVRVSADSVTLGSSSTLTTTSQTLNSPSHKTRRLIFALSVGAALMTAGVMLALLLRGHLKWGEVAQPESTVMPVEPVAAESSAVSTAPTLDTPVVDVGALTADTASPSESATAISESQPTEEPSAALEDEDAPGPEASASTSARGKSPTPVPSNPRNHRRSIQKPEPTSTKKPNFGY